MMSLFPFGRCLTLLVFAVLISVGIPIWAQSETPNDSSQDVLERHLDQLEKVLGQRVAAAASGVYQRQSWLDLRRHYLRLSAELEAGDPNALRVHRALRELRELEALVEDPQALKSHFRRLKSRSSGSELNPSEKTGNSTATGRVIGSRDGLPLASADVAYSNADFFDLVFTDENGFYEISVPAGTYTVSAAARFHRREVYDDIPCYSDCFYPNGDLVTVETGQTVTNIDFSLERLGRVTGRVVDQSTGLPLAGLNVEGWAVGGSDIGGYALTEADGSYTLRNLEPGDYWIVASGPEYQIEAFDGVPCSRTSLGLECSEGPVQTISVRVETTVEDVDFSLERRGSISGRITDARTGEAISSVRTHFVPVGGNGFSSDTVTDSEGRYQSPGLNAGEYLVFTDNHGYYVDEVYDDKPCPLRLFNTGCDPEQDGPGDPVLVGVDSHVTNIDFALDLGGALVGIVTQTLDGQPLESATVRVFDSNDLNVAMTLTEADGSWEVRGLTPGRYALTAEAPGFVSEIFDDIACPQVYCPSLGSRIDVELGETYSGLDFALDQLGALEGRVVSSDSGEPVGQAIVYIYDAETGSSMGSGHTDQQGFFRVSGLMEGSYRLFAEDTTGLHISGLYPSIPCRQGNCDFSLGGTVEVELNATVTGVDIGLELGAAIHADIRDRITGLPTPQGELTAYDASGNFAGTGLLSQEGGYVVPGLPTGQYYLVAGGYFFGQQVYGGDFCNYATTCDPLSGTLISVVEGEEVSGIEFEVDFKECQFVDSELCIRNNRFRAVVKWRDSSGNEDYGRFFWLSNDSGYFWFFDNDNIEGVVKVLNACSQPVDRYWVFAAGLTDLDVTLWITDFASGQTRTYTNSAGQAFQPIQDTNAFATCAGTTGLGGSTSVGSSSAPTQERALGGLSVSAAAKACDSASGRLCLNGGRFAVEAFYQAPGEPEQLAGASALTNDSGTFYFFSPDNVEILVKVLDACSVFERFWVFGAGLTNVRVRLVVTDTETGEVQEYVNNQGNAFEPIQDTQAFATCF